MERCKNWITTPGMRFGGKCSREATGDDGYCNICRAAIARGRRKSEENERRFRENLNANNAKYEQDRRHIAVAKLLQERDPGLYAELEGVIDV